MRRIAKGTVMIALTLNGELHDVDGSLDERGDVASATPRALHLPRERIDVVRVVEEAVGSRVWALARSGFSVSFDVPDGVLHAHVDGPRLRELVIELLDVASKQLHPAGRIRLRLENDQDWIVCSVEAASRGSDRVRVFVVRLPLCSHSSLASEL
jgi:signal transduction histidine kinase